MKRAFACAVMLALAPAPALAQQNPYADYQKKTLEAAPLELFELVGELRVRDMVVLGHHVTLTLRCSRV
jgi:hypothetical protein